MGKKADRRARRNLKHLVIAHAAMLDCCAELVALFFPGSIKGLRAGRADFVSVEKWLGVPLSPSGLVVEPCEHFLTELHQKLNPLILPISTDRQWLPMLRVLRNKLAHTGHPLLFSGFQCADGDFYTFLPRRWPFIQEEFLSQGPTEEAPTLGQLYLDSLIQEDLLSFCQGLRERVHLVVETICQVLSDAFQQFRHLQTNQTALNELRANTKHYNFESFS